MSDPRTVDASQRFESIEDPIRIAAFVQRLVSERRFVNVEVPGNPASYNSTILGLETEQATFLLDTLYPEEGNRLLRSAGALRLSATLDSSMLILSSRVVGEGETAGIRFFIVQLPERIGYRQRRGCHRVPVDRFEEIPVLLETADGGTALGILHDISAAGLGVRLTGSVPDGLQVMADVPYCLIRIPDDEPIVAAIQVRDIRPDATGAQVVGARFVRLDRATERRIEHFVATADRQSIKHRDGNL